MISPPGFAAADRIRRTCDGAATTRRAAVRWLVVGVAMTFSAPALLAQTAREKVGEGNAHFQAGRFKEAAEAYDQAGEPADPLVLPELLHNKAAARFKAGDYSGARDIWVRVAGMRDARWEGAARYNLGNCSYWEALELLKTASNAQSAGTPPATSKALPLLDRAIEQFRDALRLDPALTDARANLELVEQLKKQLLEKPPESQPNSQPSSQPNSQPSSQPESQPSQNGDQQQQQSGSQPSSQPESGKNQQSQSQPSSQPENDPNQPQDEEQKDEQKPKRDPPESQPKPQSQPQSQPASQPQPAESQPSEEQNAEAGEGEPLDVSRAEVERLLQRVRDAERMRRMMMRQREMGKYKPVERDW